MQIEAALVRQTQEYGPHIRKYELVKDGIVATFHLQTISKDSDQDGLTDIVENKFRTDPFNSDTNNNGIPDNLDMNPRKNAKRTENTIVFEALMDEWFKKYTKAEYEAMLADTIREKEINRDGGWSGILTSEPHAYRTNDSTETIMIITDDPDITAIRPKYARTIILSPTEYKKSADFKFKTDLKIFSISPLFKADGYKDLYLTDFIDHPGGGRYLAWKTNNGWRINQGYTFIF